MVVAVVPKGIESFFNVPDVAVKTYTKGEPVSFICQIGYVGRAREMQSIVNCKLSYISLAFF